MIIVLLADGFEEIEALTPGDMLRRCGLNVKTVGVSGRAVTGAHGICVVCDLLPEDVDLNNVKTVILPGGMPGTINLDSSAFTGEAIDKVFYRGGKVAAICAAPLILGRRGMLKGRRVTCYPGFEQELSGATVVDDGVVTDGNIITARGMGVATEFAEEIITQLLGKEKAREISLAICKSSDGEEAKEETVNFADYTLPTSDLLDEDKHYEADAEEIKAMEECILSVFSRNKINLKIVGFETGVRVTRFILTAEGDIPLRKIMALDMDIALELGVSPVRIVAPIRDGNSIGIEIPNKKNGVVMLRGLVDSDEFKESSLTSVCIGREFNGKPVIADVTRMPHMLVAGATGMGKSVAISSMLASLLLKTTPEQLRLILIDPKQVEFTLFDGIPQLLCPVIHAPNEAAAVLSWALKEMDRRYGLLQRAGKFSVDYYNRIPEVMNGEKERLPYIVIVIDELADLMFNHSELIEESILRLAQRSRAAGIHLIIGTQRPVDDVITDYIKANIPSRLCCKVMSEIDSTVVLDYAGAEKLLNAGDALYAAPGTNKLTRLQCAYVSETELERITNVAKSIGKGVGYDKQVTKYIKDYLTSLKYATVITDDFLAAVELALATRKISTSLIQRQLSIGYGKAVKFLDLMEELGIVSPMNGSRPRDVIMSREEWQLKLAKIKKQ